MMKLFTLRRLVILFAAGVVLFALYGLFWYGNLRVSNLPEGTVASVNGKVYSHKEFKKGIKLRPGTHRLYVTSPNTKPFESKKAVSALSTTELNPEIPVLSSDELVEFVAGTTLSSDLKIVRSRLFENNTWMVVLVGSRDGRTDAYYDIYVYRDRIWTIFDSGTGFDLEESSDNGYPNSVVRYMKGEDR
ncbi:MAG: hypothetical protein WAQ57_00865 [Candidatus Saccharimonadales bacterium]